MPAPFLLQHKLIRFLDGVGDHAIQPIIDWQLVPADQRDDRDEALPLDRIVGHFLFAQMALRREDAHAVPDFVKEEMGFVRVQELPDDWALPRLIRLKIRDVERVGLAEFQGQLELAEIDGIADAAGGEAVLGKAHFLSILVETGVFNAENYGQLIDAVVDIWIKNEQLLHTSISTNFQ
ncbi:hypothetical protein [Paenibacillus pasadenensis]|uniref:hypothetical protein n=1 Tax=Paenibacillus pasadenensis TaxID=217090 RepID=UPI000FDA3D66|nr:hypothetical protein [Paenibacillus pasadenensis]